MIAAAHRAPQRLRGILRKLLNVAGSRTGVLGLTTFANLVLRTGSSMLLTRILTPRDFGIVGIVNAIFFAVFMVTDLGFEAYLIRHARTDDRRFRNVIWTIHATRGLALFVAVALASPLIAWAFDKPVIALPLAVASVGFFIHGVTSLSLMTALRRDMSRELSLLDFGLQVFAIAVGLLLALWWRNAWSLIAAMVLQDILRAILSYVVFPDSAHRPARDREISREFLAFSRMVLASSMLTLLIAQSDKLVLGRLFTLDQFGLYAIAFSIASAPTAFVQSYIRRIAFPVYAQTAREAPTQLACVYYSVRRKASALYAFGCGGIIGSAQLIVALLYDPRYAAASIFISILTIASALRLPNVAAGEFLTATGDMKRMVGIAAIRVLWLALAMPTGFLLFGPLGIVAAVGLVELPAMFYCWFLLHRSGVLDLREELSFIALIAAGAALGFVGGAQFLHWFPKL
jgi:O-antigen/teichoic acid export membrane protein